MAKEALTPDQKRAQAYKAVFKNDTGQRVLRDLMREFAMDRAFKIPKEGTLDANQFVYHEGERNVIFYILSYLRDEITPQHYTTEMDDANDDFRMSPRS